MEWVSYAALVAAFGLIFLPILIVNREMQRLAGGYDHHNRRAQQATLEGVGRRALSAHHNGFEGYAPFAVGVLAANQRGVRPSSSPRWRSSLSSSGVGTSQPISRIERRCEA